MTSNEERLAKVETLQSVILKEIKEHMDREEEDRKLLIKRLDDMEKQQAKQKGFIGGVVFVVSAVWAAIVAFVKFKYTGT